MGTSRGGLLVNASGIATHPAGTPPDATGALQKYSRGICRDAPRGAGGCCIVLHFMSSTNTCCLQPAPILMTLFTRHFNRRQLTRVLAMIFWLVSLPPEFWVMHLCVFCLFWPPSILHIGNGIAGSLAVAPPASRRRLKKRWDSKHEACLEQGRTTHSNRIFVGDSRSVRCHCHHGQGQPPGTWQPGSGCHHASPVDKTANYCKGISEKHAGSSLS
ncbi:hypothetical protein FIBSPDRAFT_871176 [Athelia psychrophila]|uniref:Uncharacterized protein n=1 Tax=Athelia psychrophila TaxID=1759441 RepID=A0A166AHC2_9AGAM|nr:hypothetical protein FIBSPDRAFT_871176 [Fibularhizoctonia sp. CBS 109695]